MKHKNNKLRGKKQKSPALEPKWIVLIVAGLIAFVALSSFAIFRYYNEPVVARINGINIRESQVQNAIRQIPDAVIFEFMTEHADIADRLIREEAVRVLAADMIFRDHAVRLERLGLMEGAPPAAQMNEHDLMGWVVLTIANNDDEFAAFESFLPDEELVDAYELVQSLLERLLAGEDFDTLMAEYGEDPGMVDHPDGYTFTRGLMVSEFEQATLELEIGEISGIVESWHGYHIILRIEPNPYDMLFGPFHEDEELLGAKHILIRRRPSEFDLRQQAVFDGILASIEYADIIFRRALYDVPLR